MKNEFRGFSHAYAATPEDPYPLYDWLRENDPVHRGDDGVWILTRYEDVSAALRDRRFSNRAAPFSYLSARNRGRYLAAEVASNLIAFLDPPEHTLPRRVLTTALQAATRDFESECSALAKEVAEAIPAGNQVNFVEAFSVPFATRAICRMMGLPEEDAPRIKEWSGMFFYLFHAIPDAETFGATSNAVEAFRAYMVGQMDTAPEGSLIARLAASEDHGLDRLALADNLVLLLADGVENVQAGLSSALLQLSPEGRFEREGLATPEGRAQATDEILRIDSPGQYQARVLTEAVELAGHSLPARSVVLMGFAAANRDPAVFDDPAAFRPGRKGPRHLAFGYGRHACIGTTLVRQEFSAALAALAQLPGEISVDTDAAVWSARAGHRWLETLPILREG